MVVGCGSSAGHSGALVSPLPRGEGLRPEHRRKAELDTSGLPAMSVVCTPMTGHKGMHCTTVHFLCGLHSVESTPLYLVFLKVGRNSSPPRPLSPLGSKTGLVAEARCARGMLVKHGSLGQATGAVG